MTELKLDEIVSVRLLCLFARVSLFPVFLYRLAILLLQ